MLKRDLIVLCLLRLLKGADRHGHELMRPLREAFPDTKESAVYALLRQLCREGYTEQYQGSASGGPVRKYYRLTDAGGERYAALLEEWRRLRGTLALLGIE